MPSSGRNEHTGTLDRRTLLAGIIAGVVPLPKVGLAATPTFAGPGHLNAHCGAWDGRQQATFIFGGADERQVLSAFWQLRGGSWRRLPSGPPARTFAAAAFDAGRDRFILFGGNRVLFGPEGATDTLLDDHWEWDGRRWNPFDGPRPPARTEAAMAFDENRHRIILFGGWQCRDGERTRLGDVWEFDGAGWVRSDVTGPEDRSGCAMAYDTLGRRILLAGGNGPRADMWALDERGWSRLPDLPQARFNPALAYDRGRRAAVLFGGWTGKDRLSSTALFRHQGWRNYAGREPPPRNHSLLLPVGDGSRLLLIGGHNGDQILADQWEWTGRWGAIRGSAPKLRVENNH
jgi:hypothetical protein